MKPSPSKPKSKRIPPAEKSATDAKAKAAKRPDVDAGPDAPSAKERSQRSPRQENL